MATIGNSDGRGAVERLRCMSDEAKEEWWPKRTTDDAKAIWRLPAHERWSILPPSEKRIRCQSCAGIVSQFGSSSPKCHDCKRTYPGRVHGGDFQEAKEKKQRTGELKQLQMPQEGYQVGEDA